MARGYGPDTSLLTISQKMYETRDPFIDLGEIMKPAIDEFAKRVKDNETALKKALLELPYVDISKVDPQLQAKLRNELIRQKKIFANTARIMQNINTKDPKFFSYSQQAQDARNASVLINEDLDALKLLRESNAGNLTNPAFAISDWNSDISRDAIAKIIDGGNNYLKDNVVFDGGGGWFIDPNRSDDDPKKRVRLSKIAGNKLNKKEATAMYVEIEKGVITRANKGAPRAEALSSINRDIHIVFESWGNEQIGKAAFDDISFGNTTFIDVWLEKNVDNWTTNAQGVKDEKDRVRNSDLDVKGLDGVTFKDAYKKWLSEQFMSKHDIYSKQTVGLKHEGGVDLLPTTQTYIGFEFKPSSKEERMQRIMVRNILDGKKSVKIDALRWTMIKGGDGVWRQKDGDTTYETDAEFINAHGGSQRSYKNLGKVWTPN